VQQGSADEDVVLEAWMLRHLSKKTAPEAMRRFDWHALSEVQLLGSNPNSNPNPNPNPAPNLLQGEEREEKEPPPARLECAMVQQGEATKTKNKPWTYDENETLLMLVRDPTLADRRGRPKWAQVAKGLPGRSAQEARCRWRRISDAETRRKRGETFHNRCRTCGQLRRGHICPGAPPAAAPPAAASMSSASAAAAAETAAAAAARAAPPTDCIVHPRAAASAYASASAAAASAAASASAASAAASASASAASASFSSLPPTPPPLPPLPPPLPPPPAGPTTSPAAVNSAAEVRQWSSQYRGVSKRETGRWMARMRQNGKHIIIGRFDTEVTLTLILALTL
jgi:hypothetical protein